MRIRFIAVPLWIILLASVMAPSIQGTNLPDPIEPLDSETPVPNGWVNFTTYDKGFFSGIGNGDMFYVGEHFVIRNQTALESFWANHSNSPAPTNISWGTDMVLAAIQGWVTTCCESYIEFTKAYRDGDNLTVWIFRSYEHGMLPVISDPYHIIVIENVPNVEFIDPIFVNDFFPPHGSISINGGDEWTNSTSVVLYLDFFDDMSGVSKIRLSNDGIWDTEPWETPQWIKPWTLESGDGIQSVYYQIIDNAGHQSITYLDHITLDTTPPTLVITINDGSLWTNSVSATLNIASWDNGSGVSQVRCSNDGVWDTEQWEALESYKHWNLTSGDGLKIVWCQLMDNAHNTFEALTAVGLDTVPPTGYVYDPSPGSIQSSMSFVVSWGGFDFDSGIAVYDVQYRDGASGTWSDWMLQTPLTSALFGPTSPVNPQDGHTYYFRAKAKDIAGNTGDYSGGLGDTYVIMDLKALDTNPPIITNLLPSNSSVTNDDTPTIYAEYYDSSGINVGSVLLQVDGIDVTSSALVTSSSVVYVPTTPLSEGSHQAYVSLRDNSANSNEASILWGFSVESSLADATPPVITDLLPLDNSAIEDSTPTISARYGDFSGIDISSVILKLDGEEVTISASITQYGVTYGVTVELADGRHLVYLEVRDGSSNRNKASRYWSFTVMNQDDADIDGLPDDWEIINLGDLSMGGNEDPDLDGLTNLEEFYLGTDPLDGDTDADGIRDGDDPNPLVPRVTERGGFQEPWLWALVLLSAVLMVVMIVLILKFRTGKEEDSERERTL